MDNPTPIFELLLVEDSDADAFLARQAMREAGVRCTVHRVGDGLEALRFLHREGAYSDAPRPDLILLDLNMPRMNGRELLEALRADQKLRRIPVVVLTTSAAHSDVRTAYNLHANCYIVKPLDIDRFVEVVRKIETFWLGTSRLPSS